MNKKIFLTIFLMISALSLMISFWIGQLIIGQSVDSYDAGIESLTESNLTSLTQTIRNDLINDNIRVAKIVIEKNMTEGGFSEYGIFRDGQLVERSNAFLKEKEARNIRAYKRNIKYSEYGDNWGYIEFLKSDENKVVFINSLKFKLLLALLVLVGINVSFILLFMYFLNSTSEAFFSIISGSGLINVSSFQTAISAIWKPFIDKLNLSLETLEETKRKNQALQRQEDINTISRQIAHDIRSPLTALNVATSKLENVPSDLLQMMKDSIKRINSISNYLLDSSKQNNTTNTGEANLFATNLQKSVSSLIAEKELALGKHSHVSFRKDFGNESIFVSVEESEFQRVISNILNNSIDAFEGKRGSITISIRNYSDKVQVSITDDGKGIPQDVLSRIGEKNFSFGKENTESGSGLGVFHAKEVLAKYGGQFTLNSKEGVGTMVVMTFNSANQNTSS